MYNRTAFFAKVFQEFRYFSEGFIELYIFIGEWLYHRFEENA